MQIFPKVLIMALVWVAASSMVVQATASSAVSSSCTIRVPPGWQPYLVQANDTLTAVASRYGVTVEQLTVVNCLDASEIQAPMLLLVPGVGTALMTPPTSTPAPTVAPTITPLATPTAIPTEQPTATDPAPPVREEPNPALESSSATEEQPAPAPSSTGGQSWFVLAVVLVTTALAWYLGILHPGQGTQSTRRGFLLVLGYGLFILAGFLVGLLASPIFEPITYFTVPLSVGVFSTLILIPLLVLKEIIATVDGRWRLFGRLLNAALIPLLALFFIAVMGKFAEYLN